MSFRQFRPIERGEFFCVFIDGSQGGLDSNAAQFLSKTKLDIPLVYHAQGVSAQATAAIHPVLERVSDVTGIKPMVAFERNNGGASEMERLSALNRSNKYDLFVMPSVGASSAKETTKLGWDTTSVTRPIMVGDWKQAVSGRAIAVYDQETIDQHFTFIVNPTGKPEAARNTHDDLVMAAAGAYQLYLRCDPPMSAQDWGDLESPQLFSQDGWY